MPRLTFTYALLFAAASLAGATDELPVDAPAPIASAFGVALGERLARNATTQCQRRAAPALDRCDLVPPPRADIDRLVALIDDNRRVLAVEAFSRPLSESSCERLRARTLTRLERLHGAAIEVAFDAWGFDGNLWEQDIDHPWSVRGLSLSRCLSAAQAGAMPGAWRFEIAYGAARRDPAAEQPLPAADPR